MQFHLDPDADNDAKIAVMTSVVLDMHNRLFGNGQPGAIEKLDKRINALEGWRRTMHGVWLGIAKVGGVIGGIGALAGVAYAIAKGMRG